MVIGCRDERFCIHITTPRCIRIDMFDGLFWSFLSISSVVPLDRAVEYTFTNPPSFLAIVGQLLPSTEHEYLLLNADRRNAPVIC